LISLVSTGTLVAPELFPFLALGTLLFVVWVLALTVTLLRSTRTECRMTTLIDDASRANGQPNEV
jgi:hypothetical protein